MKIIFPKTENHHDDNDDRVKDDDVVCWLNLTLISDVNN